MTLCIAAASNALFGEQRIVVGFDWRIETPTASAETGFKFEPITDNWIALLAGPLQQARELVTRYKAFLQQCEQSLTELDVVDRLREPAFEMRRALANAHTHAKLAMSYDDFLQHGETYIPDDLRRQTAFDIAQQRVEAELILIGSVASAFVILQCLDGSVEGCADFASIGSGSSIAEAALYRREQTTTQTLAHTTYAVYEAKRLGEISPGVGTETSIAVLYHNEGRIRWDFASPKDKNFLERQFKKFGPKAVKSIDLPPDLLLRGKLREPRNGPS